MLALTPNPSWLEGVAYDSATRQHRVDGQRVPSVTQALSLAHPDRFASVPPATLARKAAIGTAVHLAAQFHVERDLSNGPLLPEVGARVDAWKWFCETRRVEPLLCETVVCSRDCGLSRRLPYVGRLDFLCEVDRSLLVLLDLKTGVPSLAAEQTIAYLDALYQQYPQLIAVDVHRWAVVLNGDGRYAVHAFRADARDAANFRQSLEAAYAVLAVEWNQTMTTDAEMFELPDDECPDGFELPEEVPAARAKCDGNHAGPRCGDPECWWDDLPEILPAADSAISELRITPDVETYLRTLEAAIAPYESTAKAFAEQMATLPVDTPEQLRVLGQQSLVAKDREKLLDELFEPAIRTPRQYLDRVYALKRRVLQWVKSGGETAARRYTERKRELEEADRRAQLEADRKARAAQIEADRQAAAERRRLAEEAAKAAQAGRHTDAVELIDQARLVEPVPVIVEAPPVAQAQAAAVVGMGERVGWAGAITDMKTAILAAARPDLYREVAEAIDSGDLSAGGASLTTRMIADKLRALASDLPLIPSSMFIGNPDELTARARADRDTVQWPGFAFTQTVTPVRRTAARK